MRIIELLGLDVLRLVHRADLLTLQEIKDATLYLVVGDATRLWQVVPSFCKFSARRHVSSTDRILSTRHATLPCFLRSFAVLVGLLAGTASVAEGESEHGGGGAGAQCQVFRASFLERQLSFQRQARVIAGLVCPEHVSRESERHAAPISLVARAPHRGCCRLTRALFFLLPNFYHRSHQR